MIPIIDLLSEHEQTFSKIEFRIQIEFGYSHRIRSSNSKSSIDVSFYLSIHLLIQHSKYQPILYINIIRINFKGIFIIIYILY